MGNSATREQRPPPSFPVPEERPRRREGERRETKVERDARRLERERQARLRERELSLRDEGVDGGYLVTLGVYTGVEDFNKPIVRHLIIERRLAPFFKGLHDHDPSWTDDEFVSRVRLAVKQSMPETGVPEPIPILSTSTPNPHTLSPDMPFRPRAKTMSMAVLSRPGPEMTPQEQRLPDDPIMGRPIEAALYKDAIDCPICFLSYPPYLNKTRCCDQPICSECFVQIKRPDPHPPEHEGSPERAEPQTGELQLVSEPAACPFCKQPEFGVTYESPPFRRGIIYAGQSPMSSSPATPVFGHSRRRTTSLSANSPTVITTDRIRPDWSQKLATARAHAARRAAAATALHTAAYMMTGNESRSPFRRRREGFGIAPRPDRRVVDLEEMMMMEAIRLSIADEEERRRKADTKEEPAPARQLSASSSASSIERLENSSNDSLPTEPLFNFSSLAAMIDAGEEGGEQSAKPHV